MSDIKDDSSNEKIAIRNNWLKIVVVTAVVGVLLKKIWESDLSLVLSGFNFSDLLTLFLALFSIALSVLFYFKATDTSNVFYDNTYRFTKDVSEILGRVEAGFGERLRHLDEGYSGLKLAVEKIPFDRVTAEKEIAEEEEQVKKVEEERNQLIESLAKRAQLEEKEKERLFEQLGEQESALSSAKSELRHMQRRLLEAEEATEISIPRLPQSVLSSMRNLVSSHFSPSMRRVASPGMLNSRFRKALEEAQPSFRLVLKEFQILDEDDDLTPMGVNVLRQMLRRID